MATVESNERNGDGAAREVGALRTATAGSRQSYVSRLAAVDLDKGVGEANAAVNGQDTVVDAVDAEVGDGVAAAVTAADQTASQDWHSAELAGARTSKGIGHAPAETESRRKPRALVNAEIGLDLLDDGINEGDVLPALVGPAIVDTAGGDEDGAAGGAGLQAVPGLDASAVDDIIHAAAKPVQAEDEVVGVAVVIAVGDEELVLTAIDVLDASG